MVARKQHRPAATLQCLLEPQSLYCQECDQLMWVAYATRRTVTTLNGVTRLTLKIGRCHDENCTRYHQPYRASRGRSMGITAWRGVSSM